MHRIALALIALAVASPAYGQADTLTAKPTVDEGKTVWVVDRVETLRDGSVVSVFVSDEGETRNIRTPARIFEAGMVFEADQNWKLVKRDDIRQWRIQRGIEWLYRMRSIAPRGHIRIA